MSDPSAQPPAAAAVTVDESLLTYTHVMYALHSVAVLIGVTTFHTIIGSFVGSLPSIVAVVMNYARRSAARGTYLESHFRWQLRTFWFAVLWAFVSALALISIIGLLAGLVGLAALTIWIVYRLLRGWLALRDKKPMYA
ncbi:MAG TPA: hypothetical protein VH111_02910 [Steroidobacteraceae bacterium]|nr:hypothetical protein [Steroidobacteraceae bacterium]